MDCPLDLEPFSDLILNYGSIALFFLLMLGIFALPIPDETLMIFSGVLMGSGNLTIPFTILAAYIGAICGITLSYLVGKTLGSLLIVKYGKWVGFTEVRLNHIHRWFNHYGKWTLLIGYFIPGVRHFIGIAAGLSKLEYYLFAIFAYTGAILWASLFLSLGYFFTDTCITLYENITSFSFLIFIAILLVIFTLTLIFKKYIYKSPNGKH